jgi:hypothetical protein
MAKKARTPKPPRAAAGAPRPVQAPKRRTGPSRTASPSAGPGASIQWFWPIAAVVVAIVIVGAVLGIVLTRGSSKPGPPALSAPIVWKNLPALQTGPPPWNNGATTLALRLSSLGLNKLSQEQLAFHIHQHLDVYVNGKHVTVPQAIGYGQDPTTGKYLYITELHTHNGLGIIHVESAQNLSYTLGQLFGEWGVRLTKNCLGQFKGGCDNLQYWVNGKKLTGDPAKVVLKNHEEIAITVGKPPAKIPSGYDWSGHGI